MGEITIRTERVIFFSYLFNRFHETMKFFVYKTKTKDESEWTKEFFSHWIQFSYDFKLIFNRELHRILKKKYVR